MVTRRAVPAIRTRPGFHQKEVLAIHALRHPETRRSQNFRRTRGLGKTIPSHRPAHLAVKSVQRALPARCNTTTRPPGRKPRAICRNAASRSRKCGNEWNRAPDRSELPASAPRKCPAIETRHPPRAPGRAPAFPVRNPPPPLAGPHGLRQPSGDLTRAAADLQHVQPGMQAQLSAEFIQTPQGRGRIRAALVPRRRLVVEESDPRVRRGAG